MRNILRSGCGFLALAVTAKTAGIDPDKLLLHQKGPAVLKPQFNLSETFSDNVSYAKDRKKADLITTISPGLALQVGRRDFNSFQLSYFYERLQYLDNTEFSANQHRIAARLRVSRSRLTLTGSDNIDFLSSPLGGGYSASGEDRGEGIQGVSGARVDRMTMYDTYRLTWDMSERTDLYFQAAHSNLDYEDNLPLYDSRTLTGTLGFDYRPLAKTYFFGEAYFGQTDNSENRPEMFDYPAANFFGFFAGVRGQFTERIRGTAKAGYEHRYYHGRDDTLDSPVVEISVDAQLSERTLLTGSYSRRQYESIQTVNTVYTTDALAFIWQQQIGGDGRLRSQVRASYITSDFDRSNAAPSRTDQVLLAGLTLSYDIKVWMRVFGSYTFEHLNSDEPTVVDYNVNRVTLGLQIGY